MAAKWCLLLCACWAWVSGQELRCPEPCRCAALSVDCSERGLRAVPDGLPRDARRL